MVDANMLGLFGAVTLFTLMSWVSSVDHDKLIHSSLASMFWLIITWYWSLVNVDSSTFYFGFIFLVPFTIFGIQALSTAFEMMGEGQKRDVWRD